jgi:hypothetical protein
MVSHQLTPDSAQRFLNGRDLGKDVGAVPVLVDHALEAANLPFYAAQSLHISGFCLRVDGYRFPGSRRSVADGAAALGAVANGRLRVGFSLGGHVLSVLGEAHAT